MQSRGISQKSNMWHFPFSIWLKPSLGEVHFAENPTWIGPVVPKLQELKDSQNKRNSFFWLYLTINAADFRLIPQGRNTFKRKDRTIAEVLSKQSICMFLLENSFCWVARRNTNGCQIFQVSHSNSTISSNHILIEVVLVKESSSHTGNRNMSDLFLPGVYLSAIAAWVLTQN